MNCINPFKQLIVGIFLLFLGYSSYGQCGCTFVVSLLPTETSWDGAAKGVKPGDKICFASGTRVGIGFYNIHGTAANPVTITNMCDGKVTINSPLAWGNSLETQNCSYFRITGSGNPSVQTGIEIIGAQQGMNLRVLSTNFEVDHIYVHDTGSCGIVAKTDPTCDPATWRGNFTMYATSFHDNVTLNTGCEGYYIGNSHYDGGVDKVCNGVTTHILEHDVIGVQVFNNTTTNTGNEGIQVGAAQNAVAHHNVVTNPGCINTDPSQANGMATNAGTQMTAYDNVINGGKGYSIFDGGGGGTYYNNILMNALSGAMLLQDIAPNYAPVGFTIFNNTFINNKDYGIWMYSENPSPSYCYNNITVGQNQSTYTYVAFNNKPKILWNESNNLRTQDITSVKFANPSANDFHLLPGSPAIDAGKDLSSYLVNYDFDGKTRPKGTGFDIGAFEYQPNGPHSNAGPDQVISLPTSSVTLPGSGTSSTGITGYTWTKKSGGVATLANANTATLSVSGLVAGTYVFELQVTDASGSDFDDITVTVQPAAVNQNPTANAGADKVLTLPTNSVTINGIGTDPDGSIASYAWTQVSGPAATLTGANIANLSLTNLIQGVYNFQLTVTDNLGATGTDAVTVTVNAATVNQPPVVNSGAAKTVYLPTSSVSVTATASDPDGTIATIAWVKKSGAAVTLTGANTLTVNAAGLTVGTYVLTITVTDNQGATASSDVTITVIQANQSPIANAGPDRTVTLPANSITLNGIGFDNDGTVVSYSWVEVSGPAATLADATVPSLAISNMVQGTYVFGLTVTDNQGATGYDQATVSVSVSPPPPNQLPLAFAGGNQSFSLPTNSTNLYGSGFDPDGSIVSYSWIKVSGGAVTLANTSNPTLTISNLTVGQYKFSLTVTDNLGGQNTDFALVTVSDAGTNQSPIADAGQNKIVKLPQSSVNLDGSGSDADGQIVSYLWTEVSGSPATISSPGASSTLVSNLAEGDYVFSLTVTDDKGATDLDNVTVHVVSSAANLPPTVNAGPDLTVSLPQNSVTINASASDDGTIVSYAWAKLSGPTATLVDPTVLDLALQNLVEGIYTFQLTVTDNDGASVFDVVRVSVQPGSFQSPVVSAGSDQQITLPVNQISLSGSASSPNGTISTLLWSAVSGPAATLAGTGTLTLAVTNMTAGTYIFKLTATDNNSLSSSATVQVVVNPIPPNQPPIVTAGLNTSIQLPVSEVTLTGTASDPDGSVASVFWTQTQGPNTATLQNQSSLVLSASSLIAGSYAFRLTATDNLGASGTSDVNVSVSAEAPTTSGPVVFAGNDTTIVVPDDQVVITGKATETQSTIQTYVWEQISGEPTTFNVTNQTILTVSDLKLGSYGFRLTATDDNLLSASADVLISVIEKNQDIPKFFSPNNDAVGQFWIFRNPDSYKQCKLIVFSRSGQTVYQAAPYQNNWDGTYNGRALNDGDYYYNIKCDNGNVINGAVRIIR